MCAAEWWRRAWANVGPIQGEFRQDWLQSNAPGADYTATIIMLGVRVQR
jgi:hypothetical protein